MSSGVIHESLWPIHWKESAHLHHFWIKLYCLHYMFALFFHWQKTLDIITIKMNKLNIFKVIRLHCSCCFKWNQYRMRTESWFPKPTLDSYFHVALGANHGCTPFWKTAFKLIKQPDSHVNGLCGTLKAKMLKTLSNVHTLSQKHIWWIF